MQPANGWKQERELCKSTPTPPSATSCLNLSRFSLMKCLVPHATGESMLKRHVWKETAPVLPSSSYQSHSTRT